MKQLAKQFSSTSHWFNHTYFISVFCEKHIQIEWNSFPWWQRLSQPRIFFRMWKRLNENKRGMDWWLKIVGVIHTLTQTLMWLCREGEWARQHIFRWEPGKEYVHHDYLSRRGSSQAALVEAAPCGSGQRRSPDWKFREETRRWGGTMMDRYCSVKWQQPSVKPGLADYWQMRTAQNYGRVGIVLSLTI